MGAGGAEGRMSKGSAGRGVEGRPEGTGASKSSPSSLISSAATGRAVPEPDRNRRGQARERPDPTAPQAPPNQPRELAPRGEISLGSQTPESSQLAWTADPLWKVAGPEKHRGCGCGRGSKWGHGGKPSGPRGQQTADSSSAVGRALGLLAS